MPTFYRVTRISTFVLLAAFSTDLVAADVAARAKSDAVTPAQHKALSWDSEPDPKLPNVLILGDSISIGYGLPLKRKLEGIANVYRPMTSKTRPQNCGGTTRGVEQIDTWLGESEWDVIHFNWGLHDLKHVTEPGGSSISRDESDPVQATIGQYRENMEAIVGKLKATGAKLIFATTTPVVADSSGPLRAVEAPAQYNEAALEIMKKHEIEVNDLYAACVDKLDQLQLPKNVHFKKEGSEFLADVVASKIEAALQ